VLHTARGPPGNFYPACDRICGGSSSATAAPALGSARLSLAPAGPAATITAAEESELAIGNDHPCRRSSCLLAQCALGLPPGGVGERNHPPAKPPEAPGGWLRRSVYPKAALHAVEYRAIATWLRRQGLARQTACLPQCGGLDALAGFEAAALDPPDWLDPAWPVLLGGGNQIPSKGFEPGLVGAPLREIAADHPSCAW